LKTSYVGGSGGKKANFAATVPVTLPIYRKIKTHFRNETKFLFLEQQSLCFYFSMNEWIKNVYFGF
jgi:hypothetical protein